MVWEDASGTNPLAPTRFEVRRETKFRGSWVSLLAIGAKNGAIEAHGDLVDA